MSNTFIKTIDNSSVLDNVIQVAIKPLATTTAVSTAIVASSLIPLPNTWTSTNSFNNDVKLNSNLILPIGQYSNTLDIVGLASFANETIFLVDNASNSIPVSNAVYGTTYRIITKNGYGQGLYNAMFGSYTYAGGSTVDTFPAVFAGSYDASSNNIRYGFSYVSNTASGVYSTPTSNGFRIWNYPFVMGYTPISIYLYSVLPDGITPISTQIALSGPSIAPTPLTFYAKIVINPPTTNISPLQLSYLTGGTSNFQTQINSLSSNSGLLTSTNTWTGNNVFRGVFNSIQSADTILPVSFNTTPSFSMTTGMVYNLNTTSTALTSLSLTNIPTTPQQTYVFTFVLQPSTLNSPWYLKPPSNFINITPIGSSTITVPIYGISSVVFPSSYSYILQTITVVNTSTTTSPTFVSFLSVSAY